MDHGTRDRLPIDAKLTLLFDKIYGARLSKFYIRAYAFTHVNHHTKH